MSWPPDAGEETEEDLERVMVSLSRNQPGAIKNIERQVERWSMGSGRDMPKSLQRICRRAPEVEQRDGP